MSGGSLNYFYSHLEDHVGDFGDKELDDLVKDLAKLFHDREWYLSADTGEGSWREARDSFKQKWFTEYGRKERIEKYFKELASEVLDSFGLGTYCEDCVEWTGEDDYGRCKWHKNRLTHRKETCDYYEERV